MSRFKKALLNLAVFLGVALGGGLGSAWYMIEAGSRLSTRTFGPWVTWPAAGRPDADPYTRAHIARNALLPLSSTAELTFRAKTDSRGALAHLGVRLRHRHGGVRARPGGDLPSSTCRAGSSPTPPTGTPSTAARPCASWTAAPSITLARDARPGNWLPSGRSNRVVLVLTVQDAAWANAVHDGGAPKSMPDIVRTGCR